MFDLIVYAQEQLAIRGWKASSMKYETLVFPDSSWQYEINAYNGMVFFQNPIALPIGTLITGDNNAIEIKDVLNQDAAPNMIEEFTGQVIVELIQSPENQPIVQYLQVYI